MNDPHNSERDWITERLEMLSQIETTFTHTPDAQLVAGIVIMQEISDRTAAIARQLALQGVTDEIITRKAAAAMLQVTPATIGRWLAADQAASAQ